MGSLVSGYVRSVKTLESDTVVGIITENFEGDTEMEGVT